MLIFLILMTMIIQNQLLEARLEQNVIASDQLAELINSELILASQVSRGYTREFLIPAELMGTPYTLNSSADGVDLIIKFYGQEHVYFMDGNLSYIIPLEPGINIIRKY